MNTKEVFKNVDPCYFGDTASLLYGALALIDQANASDKNFAPTSVTAILEIAIKRLLSDRLDPIIELLEQAEDAD